MKEMHPALPSKAEFSRRFWGTRAIPASKREFFNVLTTPPAASGGSVATIRMYGPIDSWGGLWGVSAQDVASALDSLDDTVSQIVLRINSPGGEVFEGMAILNMLRAHAASVTAVVDGNAASAASVIAAGMDRTVMSPGSSMMIHAPMTLAYGNADSLRETADVLDKLQTGVIEVYAAKAGDGPDWPALLATDTWFTAQEAVDTGLADEVAVIPDAGQPLTAGANEPEENTDTEGEQPAPEPSAPAARLALAPAAVARELPGTVTVPQAHLTAITTAAVDATHDADTARAELHAMKREKFLADNATKFRPVNRANWAARYDADPEGTAAIMAEMPSFIPTGELGHTGGLEPASTITPESLKGWIN